MWKELYPKDEKELAQWTQIKARFCCEFKDHNQEPLSAAHSIDVAKKLLKNPNTHFFLYEDKIRELFLAFTIIKNSMISIDGKKSFVRILWVGGKWRGHDTLDGAPEIVKSICMGAQKCVDFLTDNGYDCAYAFADPKGLTKEGRKWFDILQNVINKNMINFRMSCLRENLYKFEVI